MSKSNWLFSFVYDLFCNKVDDSLDEERVEKVLKPLLGLNPPHYTYHDFKREIVRRLYSEFGERSPTVYDLKLEICGTYKRVRGLKIKWKDNEYEVGKFELERK